MTNELKTVVIDIANKKFEINGVPVPKDCYSLTIHFENGTWDVIESHKYRFKDKDTKTVV